MELQTCHDWTKSTLLWSFFDCAEEHPRTFSTPQGARLRQVSLPHRQVATVMQDTSSSRWARISWSEENGDLPSGADESRLVSLFSTNPKGVGHGRWRTPLSLNPASSALLSSQSLPLPARAPFFLLQAKTSLHSFFEKDLSFVLHSLFSRLFPSFQHY